MFVGWSITLLVMQVVLVHSSTLVFSVENGLKARTKGLSGKNPETLKLTQTGIIRHLLPPLQYFSVVQKKPGCKQQSSTIFFTSRTLFRRIFGKADRRFFHLLHVVFPLMRILKKFKNGDLIYELN